MNTHGFAMTMLAVLVAVLTLASSASAESAWVLWQETWFAAGEHNWNAVIGTKSVSTCLTDLTTKVKAARDSGVWKQVLDGQTLEMPMPSSDTMGEELPNLFARYTAGAEGKRAMKAKAPLRRSLKSGLIG